MTQTYLITGGAGFIGSHLADELIASGHHVRVLDPLIDQVHEDGARPDYLAPEVDLVQGDVRDPDAVRRSLKGVDGIFHLAALVGVGQSMYEIDRYTAVNDLGTAVLFQELTRTPVKRVVTASSMSVYGEGLYRAGDGTLVTNAIREPQAAKRGLWDIPGPKGEPLEPLPTPETKQPDVRSIYALGKYVQERTALIVADAYDFEAVALRLFNVYGPRQALSNPYTGVLAIFASRLLNGRRPLVFEDGRQHRDFVHVNDVARAFRLAMEAPAATGAVMNVGSGDSIAIADLALRLAEAMARPDLAPRVTHQARVGDIRHCFADIGLARRLLGFEPEIGIENGLAGMLDWLARQTAVDRIDEATDELKRRGLVA